ncbi:hypothetical protein JI747_018805 [Chryseobacterium sp. RG1]|uniref:Lipoprotein n=1 Tax=Chryseobacterium tagetis TaxID=2801334 RepID=A0ABS8A5G3_9FLAO|nr:hypothetical protein [Chryseobacterium tagetis]MCA6069221.1 hypothetical protein [Chryseobacterium tagetis]
MISINIPKNQKKIFFTSLLLMISCQTKKIISYDKYQTLSFEKKNEVNEYLKDAYKFLPKKEDEVLLMFQYNCFFGKKLTLNNGYSTEFPTSQNKISYGQRFTTFKKNIGNVEINLSNKKTFVIHLKTGFDYIGVCYNEKENKLYIEYFDFPHMLVEE